MIKQKELGCIRSNNSFNELSNNLWYNSYTELRNSVQCQFEELNKTFSQGVIDDIIDFISNYNFENEYISVVALFTGINSFDRETLLSILRAELNSKLNCFVTYLCSSDLTSVKSLIEKFVASFFSQNKFEEFNNTGNTLNIKNDEELTIFSDIKKSQCTLAYLHWWYKRKCKVIQNSNNANKNLPFFIIIISDIETSTSGVLEDFILTMSAYKNQLPFIIISGFTTSLNIFNKFSYSTLSKLKIEIFKFESSAILLNNMLEKVLFASNCPFQLSAEIWKCLLDLFFNCNFSVHDFIRGIQFCMMNHFHNSNINILCCSKEKISKMVQRLNRSQINDIKKLPSLSNCSDFSKKENLIGCQVKNKIEILLINFHKHLSRFRLAVRYIYKLYKSEFQQSKLSIQDVYLKAMNGNILNSSEYNCCLKILLDASKEDLLKRVNELTELLSENSDDDEISNVRKILNELYERINISSFDKFVTSPMKSPKKVNLSSLRRSEFRMKLLDNLSSKTVLTKFELVKRELIESLKKHFFSIFLKSPQKLPAYELMVYEDVLSVEKHFNAVPRSSYHRVLIEPSAVFHCKCCIERNSEGIINSMPDVSILYKLYLRSGTQINLFDLFQSFSVYINPENNEKDEVDSIYTRFLHAIRELQYLGFIQNKNLRKDFVKKIDFAGY